MSTCTVLNSTGTGFSVTNTILDKDGNAFLVGNTVLDKDGNAFTVCVATRFLNAGGADPGEDMDRRTPAQKEDVLLMVMIRQYMKKTI